MPPPPVDPQAPNPTWAPFHSNASRALLRHSASHGAKPAMVHKGVCRKIDFQPSDEKSDPFEHVEQQLRLTRQPPLAPSRVSRQPANNSALPPAMTALGGPRPPAGAAPREMSSLMLPPSDVSAAPLDPLPFPPAIRTNAAARSELRVPVGTEHGVRRTQE